jgi:hypothetical protein
MTSGKSTRVLDNHFYKKAAILFDFRQQKWENTINSDGIALDTKMTYLLSCQATVYIPYPQSIG